MELKNSQIKQEKILSKKTLDEENNVLNKVLEKIDNL